MNKENYTFYFHTINVIKSKSTYQRHQWRQRNDNAEIGRHFLAGMYLNKSSKNTRRQLANKYSERCSDIIHQENMLKIWYATFRFLEHLLCCCRKENAKGQILAKEIRQNLCTLTVGRTTTECHGYRKQICDFLETWNVLHYVIQQRGFLLSMQRQWNQPARRYLNSQFHVTTFTLTKISFSVFINWKKNNDIQVCFIHKIGMNCVLVLTIFT